MNRSIIRAIVIIAATGIYACSGGKKDPEAVAKQFAEAYYSWDLEKCKKLSGPLFEDSELSEIFDVVKQFNIDASKVKKIMKEDKYKVTVREKKEYDGLVEVLLTVTSEPNALTEVGRVYLKGDPNDPDNGKWYVSDFRLPSSERSDRKMKEMINF